MKIPSTIDCNILQVNISNFHKNISLKIQNVKF